MQRDNAKRRVQIWINYLPTEAVDKLPLLACQPQKPPAGAKQNLKKTLKIPLILQPLGRSAGGTVVKK